MPFMGNRVLNFLKIKMFFIPLGKHRGKQALYFLEMQTPHFAWVIIRGIGGHHFGHPWSHLNEQRSVSQYFQPR